MIVLPPRCWLPTVFLLGLALAGCGPSTEALMLGPQSAPRAPVPEREVAVYRDPSALSCDYERVALIESQTENQSPFGSVSQIDLIRVARAKAGALGANALLVESLGTDSYVETEVTADSTTYSREETRRSWGQGLFLAVYEARPCSTSAQSKTEAPR